MEKNNYYVIGGQYASYCYGDTPTLTGAKRLASKSAEYWDNWQGWHVPRIYKAEDTRECTNFYGAGRCPIDGARPVAIAYYSNSGRVMWRNVWEE